MAKPKKPEPTDRIELRAKVRAGYVQGSDLTVVAAMHNVPYATATSWKKLAREAGDDWDAARRARQMAGAGAQEMFSQILEEVGTQFQHVIDVIKTSTDIPVVTKGELLVKMVDSLSKSARLAGLVSPSLNKLAVAMEVIREQNDYIAENHPEYRTAFITILEGFGQELPQRLGGLGGRNGA